MKTGTNIGHFDSTLLDFSDVELGAESVFAAQILVGAIDSNMFRSFRCLQLASGIDRVCMGLNCALKVVPVADLLIDHRRVEMHPLLALTDPPVVC